MGGKPRPFRFKPQFPYGVTDWDLALKAFIDIGWASTADQLSFENDETLAGAGVGFNVRYRRNLFITVDLGFALEDTEYEYVTAGSSQVHISATLLF
jgi:hemolysin activation/secretion protein